MKTAWRFLAIFACAALAQPSLAAHRGGSKAAPNAEAAKEGSPGAPITPLKAETDTAEHDATHTDAVSQGRAKRGAEPARKGVASDATLRIDLTTPDDGYINLRRRAARQSLVGGHKKLEIGQPAIVPHLAPTVGAVETRRTATGVTVSPFPLSRGRSSPSPAVVPSGVVRNSLGLAVTEAHIHVVPQPRGAVVTGVNGTTMGRTTRSSIGGAVKAGSAISGSSYHHR